MLFLVAYDIAEPKRLRLVARTTESYGVRVQRSVFECDITMSRLELLLREVKEIIERKQDKIQVYILCRQCRHRFLQRGPDSRGDIPEVYIC